MNNSFNAYGGFRFPTPVRVQPTSLSISGAGDFGTGNSAQAVVACSAISFVSSGFFAGEMSITTGSATNLIADGASMLFAISTSARMLWLGAELTGSAL